MNHTHKAHGYAQRTCKSHTNHLPTNQQPHSNRIPTMVQSCTNQPWSNHVPTMVQSCTNHGPIMYQPWIKRGTQMFSHSSHQHSSFSTLEIRRYPPPLPPRQQLPGKSTLTLPAPSTSQYKLEGRRHTSFLDGGRDLLGEMSRIRPSWPQLQRLRYRLAYPSRPMQPRHRDRRDHHGYLP